MNQLFCFLVKLRDMLLLNPWYKTAENSLQDLVSVLWLGNHCVLTPDTNNGYHQLQRVMHLSLTMLGKMV